MNDLPHMGSWAVLCPDSVVGTIYIYIYRLLIYCLRHLLPYLFTFSRIGLFHFEVGGRKRRLNLVLVFSCVYLVLSFILLWMHVCFVVLNLVFSSKP